MKIDFRGFDDWVPVFAGGTQIDSAGRAHDGDALIDRAVASFDPKTHEPPVVIGHPAENAPAWGWVAGVKAATDGGRKVLLAKFRDVEPTFAGMVEDRRFPKRSASFYPDGRLRHVGFLGAMPPAVKGLAEMRFSGAGAATFEFGDSETRWALSGLAGVLRGLREWLIGKDGKEAADAVVPEYVISEVAEAAKAPAEEPVIAAETGSGFSEPLKSQGGNMPIKEQLKGILSFMGIDASKVPDDALPDKLPQGAPAAGSFSEADVAAAAKAAEEKGKRAAEAEFAERRRRQEIASFCDGLVKEGRLPPSMAAGLPEFMASLDAGTVIEFGEDKQQKTPYEFFKNFVEGLAKLPIFSELATKERAGSADGRDFSDADGAGLTQYV